MYSSLDSRAMYAVVGHATLVAYAGTRNNIGACCSRCIALFQGVNRRGYMDVQGIFDRAVYVASRRAACNRVVVSLFCAAAVLLFLAPILPAQTTSTLEGTVRDKQGLAIAGVQVQVVSAELAIDRSATADNDGAYRVAALPPGIYEIRAMKTGFETA